MSELILILIALILGYFLGSINTSIIVGKLYGEDIRNKGSKNAGLTNTLRVLGKKAAALVLCGDVLKGVVACLIGFGLCKYFLTALPHECIGGIAAGAGAVIGHNWPIYFNFKGGKGALTAAAVMFMVDWTIALPSLAVFITTILITRYVSLGTILSAVFFTAISFLPVFSKTPYFYVIASLLTLIIVFRHKDNIKRLINGSENKLTF